MVGRRARPVRGSIWARTTQPRGSSVFICVHLWFQRSNALQMNTLPLAMRMLRRNWAGGELGVLLLALVIAVASVTTVGFFADRVQAALDRQANELLGGDLVVIADKPIAPIFVEAAKRDALAVAQTRTFPSMVSAPGGV